ncbi:MAG: zf-HC2 domain-containing protein, partial [Chloroflexi bacterium]|nr:zf-HC2 domain-containing protein [Chloroflexota bacterium]
MKCQQVHELLIAYSDDEVTPSERRLIQAHLAECDACREELAALSALQSHVSQALHIRAAQAAPSPQAWSRLQARIAGEARSPSRLGRLASVGGYIKHIFRGGILMKRGVALVAIAALVIIALSVTTFAPSAWAQVGELLRWFRFESPTGGGEVSISGSVEFTPLRPVYLPAGFQAMAVGLNPEAASLNYWNS